MTETQTSKRYDLEERTQRFAKEVFGLIKATPMTLPNIEANEALSKKDFVMRIKICRKEAKESRYWLELLEVPGESSQPARQSLADEAMQLTKIFGAILEKAKAGP